MPLIILAIGILILFFLIVRVKLNSFLALLLVAGLVGLAEGMPVAKLIPTIEKGLGGTLGGLAIVVSSVPFWASSWPRAAVHSVLRRR